MSRPHLYAIALFVGSALAGCSDDGGSECVTPELDCAPLYEPTFANVFTNTLVPSCAVPGVACHAREGAQGGLVFEDIDEAYTLLTGENGPARIDFDNPGCGALMQRLHSSDPLFQMPPSAPLSEAELCAIDQWVFMGAPR